MGTNCAPLLADIFLYSYEAEFIQSLLSTGRKRLASQFNFTYRYIDDVLSINNPDFENYLGQMYPPEHEIKDTTESNTSASYLDFPWLSGDVPRLPSYGIYISQLVRFARCCTNVFDFHSKNLQITSKLLTQGYRYHKLRKTFGKFFRSYSELLSKFGAISFQEYVSKGITHPVFYGDLVYKLRRVKSESNFISSGSKIVKRLRRRQYDPEIIERTIGLVLGPFTALYRSFLKHCALTNKAVGTI